MLQHTQATLEAVTHTTTRPQAKLGVVVVVLYNLLRGLPKSAFPMSKRCARVLCRRVFVCVHNVFCTHVHTCSHTCSSAGHHSDHLLTLIPPHQHIWYSFSIFFLFYFFTHAQMGRVKRHTCLYTCVHTNTHMYTPGGVKTTP